MSIKNHGLPDYSHIDGDDIRTIPDFYDNLYPTNNSEPEYQSILIKKANKNAKISRKSMKNKENTNKF